MQIEEIKIYESIDYLNLSNADGNETSYSGYQDLYSLRESMFETLARVQKYFIPSLCVLGFLGNVSSFGIFMIKSMKQKSCVNYLLFKCVTDAFFLTSLFVVWLDRVGVKWFNYHGVCQILVLVTYVSAFMSVWMVVMVTFENYVCICHPQLVTKFCTARRAQLVILLLLVLSTLCYHFPVWTSHVVLISNVSVCTEVGEYSQITEGLTYFDTALTLVLPSVLVFLFMFRIMQTIVQTFIKIRRRRSLGQHRNIHFFCQTPYGPISIMLLAVSIVFLLIHTPSHVCRLYAIFIRFFSDDLQAFLYSLDLQRRSEMLYYLNYAVNFFVFFVFSKAFRLICQRYQCFCVCGRQVSSAPFDSQFEECVCKTTSQEQQQEELI